MLHNVQLFKNLLIFILTALVFFNTTYGQTAILDENGQKTDLVNLNPDADGEAWIAGGISEAEWATATSALPELQIASTGVRAPLPTSCDNTKHEAFRPIFNQKGGSCAMASSIGYVFTYEINTLRDLASNTKKNQYPYAFTYNFCNRGSGSNGSMPNQGFDIAVKLGIPNVEKYGGFGLGDHDRWVSGYDVYLNAMGNRGTDQFTINVKTTSGIQKMKEWFDNHGSGTGQGGCLVYCYNASGCSQKTLPSASAHSGQKVYTKFGSSGGHAVTIAGYDDDVKYDYNGDGQYTNDKDLNRDGTIDVKDWEVGAVLMVNSWGTGFGNRGKIWVMYRLCADGMWSSKVYGINAEKKVVKPKMAYKVNLTHSKRNSIRIRAGVSNNTSASTPSDRIEWGKAFNYAGNSSALTSSGNFEIGLDVTRLLEEINGTTAKFFLQIDSKGGSGKVASFSLMDYTSGTLNEIKCDQTNVTIQAGSSSSSRSTYLSIVNSAVPISTLATIKSTHALYYKDNRVFFEVPKTQGISPVSLKLFDLRGRLITTLAKNSFTPGIHSVALPSAQAGLIGDGFYICKMESKGFHKSISVVLSH